MREIVVFDLCCASRASERVLHHSTVSNTAVCSSREQFSLVTMWTVRVNGVPKRVNPERVVCINDKIYSFDVNPKDGDPYARIPVDVYVFNPASYRWDVVQTQPAPGGSRLHDRVRTVVAYGDCAYLWRAGDIPEIANLVYRFDTKTSTWSIVVVRGEAPAVLSGHTACVVGHRAYVFGGWPAIYVPSQCIYFLDLLTLEWQCVRTSGDIPCRRMLHSASAIGNRMYVWGGYGLDFEERRECDRSVYFLDTATFTWVRPLVEGDPPELRESHSSFVYNGELYIVGGSNVRLRTLFGDIHKYDPVMSRWSEVTPRRSGPFSRRCFGCCVIGKRVFVFGGTRAMSHRRQMDLTDLHVLDFAPTLRTMCLFAIADACVPVGCFPPGIARDVSVITMQNSNS